MLFFSGFHSSKIPVVLLKNTPNIALFIKLMSSTQNYMHRFPLPAATEDSSKTLKQDVAPLQRTHGKHHCSSLSSFFSLHFSLLWVCPSPCIISPAPGLSKTNFTSALAPHILPVWEKFAVSVSFPPRKLPLLSSNIAPPPYKRPHSGKTLPPQPAMHMAISSSHLDPKSKHR